MTVMTKSGVSKKGLLNPALRAMLSQVEIRDAIEARADGASTSSLKALAHAFALVRVGHIVDLRDVYVTYEKL